VLRVGGRGRGRARRLVLLPTGELAAPPCCPPPPPPDAALSLVYFYSLVARSAIFAQWCACARGRAPSWNTDCRRTQPKSGNKNANNDRMKKKTGQCAARGGGGPRVRAFVSLSRAMMMIHAGLTAPGGVRRGRHEDELRSEARAHTHTHTQQTRRKISSTRRTCGGSARPKCSAFGQAGARRQTSR
jgi:hypothetical protein